MKLILNVFASPCIVHGVQFCNTPEGFESVRETHQDDECIIANEESWDAYEAFTDFLEAMGWLSSDYFANKQIQDSYSDI